MSDTGTPTRAVSDRRSRVSDAPLRNPQLGSTASAALRAAVAAVGRTAKIGYMRGAGNELFAFVSVPAGRRTAVLKAVAEKGVKITPKAKSVRVEGATFSLVLNEKGDFTFSVIETKPPEYWQPTNPGASDYPVALIVNPDGTSRFNRAMYWRKGWETASKPRCDTIWNEHVTINVNWSMLGTRFGYIITLTAQDGTVRSLTNEKTVTGGLTHDRIQRELNEKLKLVLLQAPDHVGDLIEFLTEET